MDPVVGSEQGGVRPVLVIQNDIGNQHSPTTIVAAINRTNVQSKAAHSRGFGRQREWLSKNSVVLEEQIRTIDKQRLRERICSLDRTIMEQVDQALQISMGLRSPFTREEEGFNGRTVETVGKRA